ncbi:MAG: hypothetical protein WDN30_16505 [Pararobbsia sp.]
MIATVIVMLLFTVGRVAERALHRRWLGKTDKEREAVELHEEE